MNKTITVHAKTVGDAITKAAIELGTASDNIHYEVIEKGSSGLFGFIGAKDAVISARVMEPEEIEKAKNDALKASVKKEEKAAVKEEKKPAVKEPVITEKKADKKAETKTAPAKEPAAKGVLDPVGSAEKFLKDTFAAMGMEVQIDASYDEGE